MEGSTCQGCRGKPALPCFYCRDSVLPTKQAGGIAFHPFCLVAASNAEYTEDRVVPRRCSGLVSFGACSHCRLPGELVNCTGCGARWHALCAYLKGVMFVVVSRRGLTLEF
jgi:hypothetical protein